VDGAEAISRMDNMKETYASRFRNSINALFTKRKRFNNKYCEARNELYVTKDELKKLKKKMESLEQENSELRQVLFSDIPSEQSTVPSNPDKGTSPTQEQSSVPSTLDKE
jgi:chromosome segregation ATPase